MQYLRLCLLTGQSHGDITRWFVDWCFEFDYFLLDYVAMLLFGIRRSEVEIVNLLNQHHAVLKKRLRHKLTFTMFTEGIHQERNSRFPIDFDIQSSWDTKFFRRWAPNRWKHVASTSRFDVLEIRTGLWRRTMMTTWKRPCLEPVFSFWLILKARSHQKRNYFFVRPNPMKSQRTDACGCDRRNIFPGDAMTAAQFSPRVEIFQLWGGHLATRANQLLSSALVALEAEVFQT